MSRRNSNSSSTEAAYAAGQHAASLAAMMQAIALAGDMAKLTEQQRNELAYEGLKADDELRSLVGIMSAIERGDDYTVSGKIRGFDFRVSGSVRRSESEVSPRRFLGWAK